LHIKRVEAPQAAQPARADPSSDRRLIAARWWRADAVARPLRDLLARARADKASPPG
jgi:hypothetical protein